MTDDIYVTIAEPEEISVTVTSSENTAVTVAGTGITNFIELVDTPITYSEQAGKFVFVNADEDGLEFSTSTSSDVSSNTFARHIQGTDTTLGDGAVAKDHGTASAAQIINVCYGTSETPPEASNVPEGTLYIQYTE